MNHINNIVKNLEVLFHFSFLFTSPSYYIAFTICGARTGASMEACISYIVVKSYKASYPQYPARVIILKYGGWRSFPPCETNANKPETCTVLLVGNGRNWVYSGSTQRRDWHNQTLQGDKGGQCLSSVSHFSNSGFLGSFRPFQAVRKREGTLSP